MPEAAFFDLDKTVLARSSTLAFGRPLYRAGLLGRRALARLSIAQVLYLLFGADHDQLERARDELLLLVAGWDRAEVEELARATFNEFAEPLVFAEALFLIDEHRRKGRRSIIVSASPDAIVRPIAEHLGVDDVIATKVKTDETGKYLPEIEVYAMGQGKADAIVALAERDGIDLEQSYAYSDSITDLPMMEVVGKPIAVNPDKELRKVADERGWDILQFQRPVTMEPTIPRPSPLAGLAVAATLGALGAVLVLRRLRARLS